MIPQQKHYFDIMAKRGWLAEDGSIAWPQDEKARRSMAREIFGLDLVATIDGCIEQAEDEIYGTFNAPFAESAKVSDEAAERRAVFASMSDEQKKVTLDLIHHFGRSAMFGFCCHIDQFYGGGIKMYLAGTDRTDEQYELRFQPGDFLDMHDEQLQWRNKFSRVYGGEYGEPA